MLTIPWILQYEFCSGIQSFLVLKRKFIEKELFQSLITLNMLLQGLIMMEVYWCSFCRCNIWFHGSLVNATCAVKFFYKTIKNELWGFNMMLNVLLCKCIHCCFSKARCFTHMPMRVILVAIITQIRTTHFLQNKTVQSVL